MKTLISCTIAVALTVLSCAHPASGAGFTATMVQISPAGTMKAKVYVESGKMRQEFDSAGFKSTAIVRPDLGVVWTLIASQNIYMTTPLVENPLNPSGLELRLGRMADRKILGEETINGQQCTKIRYVYHNRAFGTMTQWVSKELDYPIRIEVDAPYNRVLTEFNDIEAQDVPDSMFEVPEGYFGAGMPIIQKKVAPASEPQDE
jgi:outer membrane lipoprotein-sorting protein